jgi:hypothetical protein
MSLSAIHGQGTVLFNQSPVPVSIAAAKGHVFRARHIEVSSKRPQGKGIDMHRMTSAGLSLAFKLAVLTLLLPCIANAAPSNADREVKSGPPQVGIPVTAHSINVDLRNLPKAIEWKPGMTVREAHRRQYMPIGSKLPHAPTSKPTATDRLNELQRIFDDNVPAHARSKTDGSARININNPNTGVSPGDPVVEVGASHVIYAVNSGGSGTHFKVYDKAGNLVAGPTTFGSLAPAGNACTADRGDPLVHYDRQAGRWFMLTMDDAGLCTYVSKTSNPVTGGWWFYRYATPVLPDYPHCGVWNDAYVCGTNEGSQAGTEIYAFDRANMLTGATARPAQRFNSVPNLAGYGFHLLTPSTFYGTTAAPAGRKQILARHNDDEAHAGAGANGTQDFIELYELNLDWNTPANSNITTLPRVAITEFNSWFRDYSTLDVVPQPGSTSRLDPIREVLLNQLSYRNFGTHESITGTLATNQNPARTGTVVDSGVRWFELRRVGAGGWTLHQEGTFSPGDTNTHHLMGTIAMDKFGNIGMGYNITKTSATTKFPSLRYTGRNAADPLGVMTLGETEVATGAAAETSGRWGDYYQMTVDPVDDCTFWFVGMYRPSGSWQTRIADFKFPGCISPPVISSLSCSGTGGGFCSVGYTPATPTPTFSWSGGFSGSCTGSTCSGVCGTLGSFTIKITVTITNSAGSATADAYPFCQR